MKKVSLRRLLVAQIHATQDWLDDSWVEDLRLMLRNGLELEPISVALQGGEWFTTDGHHRLSAYLLERGDDCTIPVRISPKSKNKEKLIKTWR